MLSLDDAVWNELNGAFGVPFNPVPWLRKLEFDPESQEAWGELWENLHHQGEIGAASYAAVLHLARIYRQTLSKNYNFLALASVVELRRHQGDNPALPSWLVGDYMAALQDMLSRGKELLWPNAHADFLVSYFSLVACVNGEIDLARVINLLDDREIVQEVLQNFGY